MNSTYHREYYVIRFQLDHIIWYIVWYRNGSSGVVSEGTKLVAFKDVEALRRYAAEHLMQLNEEPNSFYDFDSLQIWLANPSISQIDSRQIIDSWNLFDDVSRSTGVFFEPSDERLPFIYDNIFHTLNIRSIVQDGGYYQALWSEEDLKLIHQVLSSGLHLLRGCL